MQLRICPLITLISFTLLASACPAAEGGQTCQSGDECPTGQLCLDGQCRTSPDGGMACEAAQACGTDCCETGEICGGDFCCTSAELCGGICCGPDTTCDVDLCVVACEAEQARCGAGAAAVCCDVGDVCYLGACTTPGAACSRTNDCNDGEYCDTTVGRCLPRVPGAEACEVVPEVSEFVADEEWHWDTPTVLPDYHQVMMAPMVANLTDDNDDGEIDENDIPEVIFNTFKGGNYQADGVLRAISGDGGAQVWPTADPGYRTAPGGELAIGELIASSPGPEIVACESSPVSRMMIVAANGEVLRRFDTDPNQISCGGGAPAIGDMNGDGIPEILMTATIAHADGTLVRSFPAGGGFNALADVDDDGELELISSAGVYKYDGTRLWERRTGGDALPTGGNVAIADLDLDGDAEIILVHSPTHSIRAVDAATGEDVWGPFDINPPEFADDVANDTHPGGPGSGGGPPTIANFDDDPNPEIAFAGAFAYVVFNHDGSRAWFYETRDRSSRATGSSLFDFEADGRAEVLYNDELAFRVFRGSDGSLLREQCNSSGTLTEFPIVVDVDNDNEAEIVVMENDYGIRCPENPSHGIHVFGHPTGEWVRTRRIFNQHTYHVTNVNEDGTIPRREVQNWKVPNLNNFRLNAQPDGVFDAADAVLEDLSVETDRCPRFMAVRVRVRNQGSTGMPAGVPVTFYADDGTGPVQLGRVSTTRGLLPGESEVLELSPGLDIPEQDRLARPRYSFTAVLNDPRDAPVESFKQCRNDNDNTDAVEMRCPPII